MDLVLDWLLPEPIDIVCHGPAGYINLVMTFLSFLHAGLSLPAIWGQPAYEVHIPWLSTAGLNLTIDIEISSISVAAMMVVTGLNFLAQIYAIGYMEMDWCWGRFKYSQ